MKILINSRNEIDMNIKSSFLRSKGILTYISTSRRGMNASDGLWVVVDDQYTDALACLKDPDYQVANPLDENKMQELESMASQEYNNTVNQFLIPGILILVAVIFILAILYVRASSV